MLAHQGDIDMQDSSQLLTPEDHAHSCNCSKAHKPPGDVTLFATHTVVEAEPQQLQKLL